MVGASVIVVNKIYMAFSLLQLLSRGEGRGLNKKTIAKCAKHRSILTAAITGKPNLALTRRPSRKRPLS